MSISHELRVRLGDDSNDEPGKLQETSQSGEVAIDGNLSYNPKMPMLTRQGFLDLSAIEYLVNPTKALDYLRKAIEEYGIWKELGEMPKSVLPNNSLPKASRFKAKEAPEGSNEIEEVKETQLGIPPPLPKRTHIENQSADTTIAKDVFDEVDLKEKECAMKRDPLVEGGEAQVKDTIDEERAVRSAQVGDERNRDDPDDNVVMVFEKS
jgi:hypothetical protein